MGRFEDGFVRGDQAGVQCGTGTFAADGTVGHTAVDI